jgi:monoamine oxidase
LSDDEIISGAMRTLRVMFGGDIPEPVGVLITRWGRDPFSFGAYSHIPPFASGDDYDALAEPVEDVLFFAGEAASREYPSTVHGAYLSGVRAAGEM